MFCEISFFDVRTYTRFWICDSAICGRKTTPLALEFLSTASSVAVFLYVRRCFNMSQQTCIYGTKKDRI